ncbi:MAG: hypothetical protein QM811_25445 [Pirellulales bacterium]
MSGGSLDNSTTAKRSSKCGKKPFNPSAHSVQYRHAWPMLWMANNVVLSPNIAESVVDPSSVRNS